MKKTILSILLIMTASVFSNLYAQRETPAGAGDKNLADNNIKMRSVEMDRIKRDADLVRAAAYAPISKDIVKRFPEIKEDFESIQISQGNIISAYSTGSSIDYAVIEKSAADINKKANRLDANLFDVNTEVSKDDKSESKDVKAKSIRNLIVELDNAIGNFVSSKIFGNIKVIEPEVAIKTRTDLDNIRHLSDRLSKEAKAMK